MTPSKKVISNDVGDRDFLVDFLGERY